MRVIDKDTIEITANSQHGFDNGQKILVPIKSIIEATAIVLANDNPKYHKIRYFLTIRKNEDPANWRFYDIKINKKEYEAINEFLACPYPFPARPTYNAICELEVND